MSIEDRNYNPRVSGQGQQCCPQRAINSSYAGTPAEVDAQINRAIDALVSSSLVYRGDPKCMDMEQQVFDAIGTQVLRELSNRREALINQVNGVKFLNAREKELNNQLDKQTQLFCSVSKYRDDYMTALDAIRDLFVPDDHDLPALTELPMYIAKVLISGLHLGTVDPYLMKLRGRVMKYVNASALPNQRDDKPQEGEVQGDA